MATYFNATNPFIEPDNNKDPSERCNDTKDLIQKRNVLGMARMQSKKERKRAKKRAQMGPLASTDSGENSNHTGLLESPTKIQEKDMNANLLNINQKLIESCTGELKSDPELDSRDNQQHENTKVLTDQVAELVVDEIVDPPEPIERTAQAETNNRDAEISSRDLAKDEHSDGNDPQENCGSPTEVGDDELAPVEKDSKKYQHIELIKKLRMQLRDLERYAYERGELERVPASVLVERQTVILDSLKRKLPLSIDGDRIEKLELEELKSQVDKEISDLIDPLISKDHLVNQLKTQLRDLESYILHLHKTLGKNVDKRGDCQCQIHGCSTPSHLTSSLQSLGEAGDQQSSTIMNEETLPKTSRLIRGLMAQLICSDMKIQEAMKMEKDSSHYPGSAVRCSERKLSDSSNNSSKSAALAATKPPQFHDTAVWNMHIDRVVLATDSLTNLFGIEGGLHVSGGSNAQQGDRTTIDESLVDSIVRRQLVPAIRDLLAYGLIDPKSIPRSNSSFFFFDPFYLISTLTCLPGSQSYNQQEAAKLHIDKTHVWNVIEDYFNSRNEPQFKSSSVKTLSQSFNLAPSMDGPIKVTSKQGLLIAVDDIIERLSRCKPNGPESHFKLFVYTALNQKRLATWLRIVFKNRSVLRKFYHNFSFVSQPDKMDKFLHVIDAFNQIEFKLNTETSSVDQFLGVF